MQKNRQNFCIRISFRLTDKETETDKLAIRLHMKLTPRISSGLVAKSNGNVSCEQKAKDYKAIPFNPIHIYLHT